MIIGTLICLIILTSQCVHSKVIIVNSNNGNDNTECCVNGTCTCSSLSTALLNIDNNTIINITSESVVLNNTTTMGSGKLTNITITGSDVTIMCNNSGSVYCESCDDVMIEGITWERCGDPSGTNIAGVTFNGTSNISLVNCTFQHSQITAVSLLGVSDNILIQGCSFLSNIPNDVSVFNISRISSHEFSNNLNITVTFIGSYFYNNSYSGVPPLNIHIVDSSVTNCNIIFKQTKFISNQIIFLLHVEVHKLINVQLTEVSACNNSHIVGIGAWVDLFSCTDDVILSIISSNFYRNYGSNMKCSIHGNRISVRTDGSNFSGSNRPEFNHNLRFPIFYISSHANNISEIMFYEVQFYNNLNSVHPAVSTIDTAGAASIVINSGNVKINMSMVNFISNEHLGHDGGALTISLPYENGTKHSTLITGCKFIRNKSPGHGSALYIDTKNNNDSVQITNTTFDQNVGYDNVVYLQGFLQQSLQVITQPVVISNSNFTNNYGSSLYLSSCDVKLLGTIWFKNNAAYNGGAMYIDQETTLTIDDKATVQFIANTADLSGGAIYVNLVCSNRGTGTYNLISTFKDGGTNAIFINNSAMIVDNSLYFSVPTHLYYSCGIRKYNINDPHSFLYVPCKFNYSQPVNGRMMYIPCNYDYTRLNGTGAPVVTSPYELRLYFPFNDGYDMSFAIQRHNYYFIENNILGNKVRFTAAVFDYFGKPTVPTQVNIKLYCSQNTECSAYAIISDNHNYILTHTIDNSTILYVNFKGKRIDSEHINLTLALTSPSHTPNIINATLVIELVPCTDHSGYTYSEESQTCVCYHHNVKCNDDRNEIKRGYWFGSIASKATTSLCPNHYCEFTNRKQTSEGYFELPNTINGQCNDHRVGRACGKCSSGYTLSYDSTDCISVDQCGIGWTVLVITLTCLYWIAVVAGVFGLMYFRSKISLGYLYGLIYYYSMVGILLNNNPYVSDDAFQFVSILSSVAQLTPQFLGKLCFVKGLSGIDQLFIHYSHAVGVSLLLLLIVVAARCSARISLFVHRCIIRVICLLILLSYTSIASTSLQLLLPLKFTNIKEWYTYSSPSIQYFHGRHIIYGVVAIIFEVVIGTALPLLLLFKINFNKFKPLLDQFQGCYKDKYR